MTNQSLPARDPRNEREAHALLASPRGLPAWQRPAPKRPALSLFARLRRWLTR